MELLDIFFKTATIIIALVNLFLVIKFFRFKIEKEDVDKEKDRNIQWLKTIILDHNLKHFYTFFEDIETELMRLKDAGLSIPEKEDIDQNIGGLFIILRRKFIDSLIGADRSIYNSVITRTDELHAHLTNTIFDIGVNLSHQPKYEELILEKLTVTKTDIIKLLFSYRG